VHDRSDQEQEEFTDDPDQQQSTSRTTLTVEFVDDQQQRPCATVTPDNNSANETIFFDSDTPTSANDDNQSTDSNGPEVESLTNRMDTEQKPKKLISPIVQRIVDLHDRALDKFMRDYKCNIKMPHGQHRKRRNLKR
jgi:hypothetical protein